MDEELGDGRSNSVWETCYLCGQQCPDETAMNIHMASHHEEPVCLFCDFVAIDSDELTDHINQLHPSDVSDKTDVEKVQDKITCLFCDFMSASSDEMNTHINLIHLNDSPCNGQDKPVVRTNDRDNRSIQMKDRIPPANSYTQTVLGVNSGFLEVEKDHEKPKLDDRIKFKPNNALLIPKLASTESSINGSHFGIHSEKNKPNLRSAVDRTCGRVDANSSPVVSSGKCSSDLDESPSTHIRHSNGDSVLNRTTAGLGGRLSPGAECYICPFCEFVTDNEQTYESHLSEEQSVSETPMVCDDTHPAVKASESDSSSLPCPFCGMVFAKHQLLERHVHEHCGEELISGIADTEVEGLVSEDQLQSASDAPVFDEERYRVKESRSTESFQCPICGVRFMYRGPCESHVNRHFQEESSNGRRERRDTFRAEHPLRSDSLLQSANYAPQVNRPLTLETSAGDGDVEEHSEGSSFHETTPAGLTQNGNSLHAWPPSLLMDDMSTATVGVYEQLVRHYGYKRTIANVWLCSHVVHYASKSDRGWGCGLRNFQMLLSCLMTSPVYSGRFLDGCLGMPSLLRIQQMLESAWNAGFDLDGSRHFDGNVVNTKSRIGATDVAALLSSRGIKCTIVDFHAPTEQNGTHPLLFDWAKDYFARPALLKPPLYFQYSGHSKTIVGVEEHHDDSLRLLILDPSVAPYKMKSAAQAEDSGNLIRLIRHPLSSLRRKQYQLLAVDGILNDYEIEESKIIKSIRVP